MGQDCNYQLDIIKKGLESTTETQREQRNERVMAIVEEETVERESWGTGGGRKRERSIFSFYLHKGSKTIHREVSIIAPLTHCQT
jgi:hypothetical protein